MILLKKRSKNQTKPSQRKPFNSKAGNENGKGSFIESLVMALGSAAFFIAWGLWVNWEHGFASRVQVACVQAAISFIATLGLAEVLRKVAMFVKDWRMPWLWTGIIGWLFMNSVVFSAHFFAGTPELLHTMIPGMITGAAFSFGYGRRVSQS
ncbi:hypothetical protein OAI07_00195 [Akkermansiaceae bacterium]|nr:hypothetical protein [Akkermansiaceae bacterium]